MKYFLKTFILILLFFPRLLLADIYFEPFYGLSISGSGSWAPNTSSLHDGDYKPRYLGFRFGFDLVGMMGGFHYEKGSSDWQANFENSTTSVSLSCSETNPESCTELKQTQIGGFLGYKWPIGVKFMFLLYYSSLKTKDFLVYAEKAEFSGIGYGLALGYDFLSFAGIQLEYRRSSYGRYLFANNEPVFLPTGEIEKPVFKTLVISLNFPLRF